ncbi:hypothetical protein KNE206_16260 [Kitasatospora sp. NE20-6]|uniref:hypothetical protein n=1 Tax=Kitasatospora sp. NE20-6 TaxID=2859066 RepID=UPI0034DC720D
MSRALKTVVAALAAAAVLSTPAVWLLDGPGPGQFVGATVQAATGVAALVWAVLQGRPTPAVHDSAEHTGPAVATGGGRASSGVTGPADRGGGSATVRNTGAADSDGPGSRAETGVHYYR